MKKKFIFSLLIIAAVFSGTVLAQEHEGPRIEVKETRYDFGKVAQGSQVSHLFEVKSAGTEPLVIERVQPS